VRLKNRAQLRVGVGFDAASRHPQILGNSYRGALDALNLLLDLMFFNFVRAGERLQLPLAIDKRATDDQPGEIADPAIVTVFVSLT